MVLPLNPDFYRHVGCFVVQMGGLDDVFPNFADFKVVSSHEFEEKRILWILYLVGFYQCAVSAEQLYGDVGNAPFGFFVAYPAEDMVGTVLCGYACNKA